MTMQLVKVFTAAIYEIGRDKANDNIKIGIKHNIKNDRKNM